VPSPAIFDQEKLNWLNGYYIRHLELPELLERAKPFLESFDLSRYSNEALYMMLGAVREPITVLSELPKVVSYFFEDTVTYEPDVQQNVLHTEDTFTVLRRLLEQLLPGMSFESPEVISEQIKALANDLKPMKTKTVMWAIRAALTGRTHGADMGKTLYILGKDTVIRRVEDALKAIACLKQ
jgi:glutamyl/glutaminyl-tRNA synthetase